MRNESIVRAPRVPVAKSTERTRDRYALLCREEAAESRLVNHHDRAIVHLPAGTRCPGSRVRIGRVSYSPSRRRPTNDPATRFAPTSRVLPVRGVHAVNSSHGLAFAKGSAGNASASRVAATDWNSGSAWSETSSGWRQSRATSRNPSAIASRSIWTARWASFRRRSSCRPTSSFIGYVPISRAFGRVVQGDLEQHLDVSPHAGERPVATRPGLFDPAAGRQLVGQVDPDEHQPGATLDILGIAATEAVPEPLGLFVERQVGLAAVLNLVIGHLVAGHGEDHLERVGQRPDDHELVADREGLGGGRAHRLVIPRDVRAVSHQQIEVDPGELGLDRRHPGDQAAVLPGGGLEGRAGRLEGGDQVVPPIQDPIRGADLLMGQGA